MELEWTAPPTKSTQRVMTSPSRSQWSDVSQRRRSSAASARPAGPPPNLPIPSVPITSPPVPSTSSYDSNTLNSTTRPIRSTSFARPSASPNLSSIAAFSQTRQVSSVTPTNTAQSPIDDLSDPPPQSYFVSSSSRQHDRNRDSQLPDRGLLSPPTEQTHRSEHRPSSRRALTRALELAREAVQLDANNDNPEAAVSAYAQSVALLSEVMERVRNGDDGSRRSRRRSVAAQEEEIRRLKSIYDTYADRMAMLSLIYSIPPVPYPTSSYPNTNASGSATSDSPTTSVSPSSENSPHIPAKTYTDVPDDFTTPSNSNGYYSQEETSPRDEDTGYTFDESLLARSPISGIPATQHHPYAAPYDAGSGSARRRLRSVTLPPKAPPPTMSPPPAPINMLNLDKAQLDGTTKREIISNHNRTTSGASPVETSADGKRLFKSTSVEAFEKQPERLRKRSSSPPLPPLPSPTASMEVPETPRSSSLHHPPSPRTTNVIVPRPRGASQVALRTEVSYTNAQATRKMSAPPSTRSASPAESTTSAGSHLHSKAMMSMSNGSSNGLISRTRAPSQSGIRPTMGSNQSIDSRPPLPTGVSTNGQRKISEPIKASLTIEPPAFQGNGQTNLGFGNLPTTPTSPLPPLPPSDPLLQPYHMMNLLRGTMINASGGYVTRRLHVPCEVWSQGGAKLNNLDEKIRVVTILCGALNELESSSAEHFGAGNVSSGMALGIGSIGRKEADAWLSKLEDFSNVCDVVVADFGKKLGVGEGFVSRKSTWSYKLGRQFDKLTNAKNLDSPAAYVLGLKKLFKHAQLLDEHTRAVCSQPIAPAYAAFPVDIRISAEQKLKRFSDFFAKVVLTFVIRDLSQLLDKYVKKCEKWLEE
ncbi:hypothetical protein CVT24_000858 [Panaeolus cyanescens]|uniref:MIT domain-containing protein n=1 Tax=Panaeolus cyanescens TaxID=181874 RepID=A0A409VWX5_9AGAR|nr:hypothetical protein CVT24_000858 [Panaeolus cyanescens]